MSNTVQLGMGDSTTLKVLWQSSRGLWIVASYSPGGTTFGYERLGYSSLRVFETDGRCIPSGFGSQIVGGFLSIVFC